MDRRLKGVMSNSNDESFTPSSIDTEWNWNQLEESNRADSSGNQRKLRLLKKKSKKKESKKKESKKKKEKKSSKGKKSKKKQNKSKKTPPTPPPTASRTRAPTTPDRKSVV